MNMLLTTYTVASYASDIIKLFQSKSGIRAIKVYEEKVLDIMNLSRSIFPGNYEYINAQSHGEPDFIDIMTGAKYDAKLPFEKGQIKYLTDGESHKPDLIKWTELLCKEAAEFNIEAVREGSFDLSKTTLYPIIKSHVETDKIDENIVFFFPFPIVPDERNGIHLQFALDYLGAIYQGLNKELDLNDRKIYAIYPTGERNCFSLRCLSSGRREYVEYDGLNENFLFEVSNLKLLKKNSDL